MSEEIELKLEVEQSAIPALLKSDALKRRGVRFRPARRLVTTYYDTKNGALRKKGVFLRIREDGRTIVQTVKTAGHGGVLAQRGEWDWTLANPVPDLALAAETGLKPLVKRARKGGLAPVFASEIDRRLARIAEDGAELELALDSGLVRAGRRTAPFAELEIEVKSGPPSSVFALAREIVVLPGIRIGLTTKAARGFALASGTPLGAVKAIPAALEAGMSLAAAEAAILRSCAAQIAANLPATLDRKLPDGIHQMRVALRRLRAALGLFKDTMPPEARKHLRRDAGRLAKALGPARDLDVLLAQAAKQPFPPADLANDVTALKRHLAQTRRAAWTAVLECVNSPDISLLVLALAERATILDAEDMSGPDTVAGLAMEALDARQAEVLALGHDIDALDIAGRHRLRLALKKLRYAADFFATLFPGKPARQGLKSLAALQDSLGAFNDAACTSGILDAAIGTAGDKRKPALDRAALFAKGGAAQRAELAWAEARERWDAFAGKRPFWRSAL